ncbi:hypothetical protein [Klebsiella pneumoniae IS39]|nr:hypothetical protein [Klebsiella pneumoniae IS39]
MPEKTLRFFAAEIQRQAQQLVGALDEFRVFQSAPRADRLLAKSSKVMVS